jgi:transposase InsO family protein
LLAIERQVPKQWGELIQKMRLKLKWTTKQIAQALSLAYSTVTAVLRRLKLNRVSHLEPVQPVQRYEHPKPDDMLHMDIKKLPRFDRPGHRVTNNRRQNTRGAREGIKHEYTRPYTPSTDGKAERFIQTMIRERAYAEPYANDISRTWALTDWINHYNKQRPHGSIGNLPPVSRIPKLREQRV